MAQTYRAVIIGGGFYGLGVAIHLKEIFKDAKIIVLERSDDFMSRASYANQARVHGGYHYPRSLLTALRSQVNLPNFMRDYGSTVVTNFDKYYAVAKRFSKVTAPQFYKFCERIDAPIKNAPEKIKNLFDEYMVEDVFEVKEYAFDAVKLKKILLKKMKDLGIEYDNNSEVQKVAKTKDGNLFVQTKNKEYIANEVYNCTYSAINIINRASGLPIIPMKHELTEMALIKLPKKLEGISVTMMCGPFFSFMPFPAKNLFTLSHVRYTPHTEWHDPDQPKNTNEYLKNNSKKSHFKQMIADASRYIPDLKDAEYKGSLWEVKTVLPRSESDDSRPILFKYNHGIKGYHCIMGGKIDNIYDVFKELDLIYDKERKN